MNRRAAASAALAACVGASASGFALAAGDAERGAAAFRSCIACHTLEPGRHMTGPSLAGVWGRKAASSESYRRYSEPPKKSGLTWDERTLDAWLRAPQKLVPGNAMQFPGLADDAVRADLLAFLKAASEGELARVPKSPPLPDLKSAGPVSTIASIRRCGDSYFVTNARGQTQAYWEFNLRFKTDSSQLGPSPGKPAILRAGMQGDRASVVFSSPAEIGRFIEARC